MFCVTSMRGDLKSVDHSTRYAALNSIWFSCSWTLIVLFRPIFSLLSLGLSLPINFHFKIAASKPQFSNMAFDWLAAVLPANQKPWWKIADSLQYQQGICYLCQSLGSLLLTDKPALGLRHGLVITSIWNVWYVPQTPVYLNPLFQVGHGMDE